MADFKTINTQEEFDNAIKDRLNRAESKIRDEFKGWLSPEEQAKAKEQHKAEIDGLKQAHSKELEKYAGYDEKFAEMANTIHGYEVSNLKLKIAQEKKLPFDAVEFLQGDDEKTISESADRLASLTATQHSYGFTRNTETGGNDKDAMWRELSQSLRKG